MTPVIEEINVRSKAVIGTKCRAVDQNKEYQSKTKLMSSHKLVAKDSMCLGMGQKYGSVSEKNITGCCSRSRLYSIPSNVLKISNENLPRASLSPPPTKLSISPKITPCSSCQNLCAYPPEDWQFTDEYRQTSARGAFITSHNLTYFSKPLLTRPDVSSPLHRAEERSYGGAPRVAEVRRKADEIPRNGQTNNVTMIPRNDQMDNDIKIPRNDQTDNDTKRLRLFGDNSLCSPVSESKSTRLRPHLEQCVETKSNSSSKSLTTFNTSYLVEFFVSFFCTLINLFVHRGSPSSSRLSSFVLVSLVWSSLLSQTSMSAFAYPPHKYSPDSYGLWDRSLVLDDLGHYKVQWTASSTDIQFRLTVRTRGYIGFGLSSKSRMDGADIVVGWVHSGKAYLQDRHGLGNLEPAVDRFQDWTIVSGYENDTHTVLHVSRPLNTCDPHNDHAITNDTSRVLWAYHPDDPVDPDSPRPRLHYHGDFRRGTRSVFLLDRDPGVEYGHSGDAYGQNSAYPSESSKDKKPEESEIHTWTLNSPGVEVKADMATVYWCKLFRKPLLVQKNHIIKFEPIFSAGNERHVHHILVSECTSDDPAVVASLEQLADSSGGQCYSQDMSPLLRACSHVVVAWAVGSKGLTLPPETGYPLSPNGPTIFLMQVHYDNPDSRHFQDHSGIRVHYTHKLRNFDAGVLSVGLDPNWKHLIPPGQASVLSSGHCVSECTSKAIPPAGIQVFGAVVQTHLLGREVRLRHLRQGVELDPIAQDLNYDYSYLEYRLMKQPRTVLPGDHLISECKYSSVERSAITLGGINTRDEMCLSYLYYWPRSSLSLCHSKPSLNTVLQSLGIEELSHDSDIIKIRKPQELAGKTLEWRLVNYDWEFQFENFQRTTHTGTFNPMCRSRGHSLLPILEEVDYEYPNISEPWFAEDTCRRPQWPHAKESSVHHRRQRPHHRRQHPHLAEGLQDEAQGPHTEDHASGDGASPVSAYDGSDVMFDDDISSKPIKRIDADPVRKFDVFMPIREDVFDAKNQGSSVNPMEQFPGANGAVNSHGVYGNSGRTVNTRNRSPFQDLREEFDAMERDLEEEVNHNRLPDSFQERTAHNPRANSAGAASIPAPGWKISLFFIPIVHFLYNKNVFNRLKSSILGC